VHQHGNQTFAGNALKHVNKHVSLCVNELV
jgi:hypothetical protein